MKKRRERREERRERREEREKKPSGIRTARKEVKKIEIICFT